MVGVSYFLRHEFVTLLKAVLREQRCRNSEGGGQANKKGMTVLGISVTDKLIKL